MPKPARLGGLAGSRPGGGPRLGWRRWLWAAACLACGGPLSAGGVPDQASLDLDAALAGFEARLAAPGSAGLSAAVAIEAAGLVATIEAAPPALSELSPAAARPAQARRADMRLALTMLSQAHGDGDNFRVVAAQTEPSLDALVLTEGRATLADLRRLLAEQGLPAASDGRRLTLRVPVVVWPDATLDLVPGDVLELSRADGAFLMNFGRLRVQGATIAAVGEPSLLSHLFVPFVATAEAGRLEMRGARVVGLGFGDTLKFAGLSVLRGPLSALAVPARIEGSSFEDVMTVAVSGEDGAVLAGNRFRDMRGSALIVVQSRDARVLSNLFLGLGPTNAIRIEQASLGGLVAGNVVLGGDRAGIVVRGGSTGVTVSGNVVWRREGGGIALLASDCGRLDGNLVIGNDQKGIEVRASLGATLVGNAVYSNHSAGIWVSDQPPGAITALRGNVVAWNRAGLAGARGEGLLLDGNDFSGQFQQLLAGDLAVQTPEVARDLRGRAPFVLSAGGRRAAPADPACAAPASLQTR